LIAASVDWLLIFLRIRGIKLIKLISSPTQAVNHDVADAAIRVPVIKKIKNVF
jgi:hypothetical protein